VTSHFIQVNSPIDAGEAGIAAIDVEMRVNKGMVRAERNISWVRNIERADQWGYVSPRV
jgi:hypothetical protein